MTVQGIELFQHAEGNKVVQTAFQFLSPYITQIYLGFVFVFQKLAYTKEAMGR